MIGKLVVASSNAGKIREIGEILAPLAIELVPQGALGVPDARPAKHLARVRAP